MEKYLQAGKIVNTHGYKGQIMIQSWCDSPEILTGIKTLYLLKNNEYIPLNIEHAVVHKGMSMAKVMGIESIEEARLLKNKIVYANRQDIPVKEGAYFICDLKGLKVINADSGRVYGVLKDVINNSSSDIYEIDTGDGIAYMPAVDEFVSEIDLNKGIFVRPIEGMFNEI